MEKSLSVEISNVFLTLSPDTSHLPKTLVLFLHTTTVPEAMEGGNGAKDVNLCDAYTGSLA